MPHYKPDKNSGKKKNNRVESKNHHRKSDRKRSVIMVGTTTTTIRQSSRTTQSAYKSPATRKTQQQNDENTNATRNGQIPNSPSRGHREALAKETINKRDSSSSEEEEEDNNSSFENNNRNSEQREENNTGGTDNTSLPSLNDGGGEEKKGNNNNDETKPVLSAFEQKLANKKPISTDPKTFDPDTVLKIDEDFSKKAISLGYELGTIKHSAYALLAMAGPGGMTVANIVSIAKRLDLYNWGTCKTPNNSVTAALSQDAHFQRVAPSTYALKEHVPDDLCTTSIAHKAAHTKKREREERRDTGRNATTTTSSGGGGDFNMMMGADGGGHTKLQDRKYHHQKAVEQAKKRKAMAMYESEEDEYFDGPAFLFRARSETRDQENSEEENEDRYDERRENYHTQRIQHEEEPHFAYKDVAERLALECFRRRADLQPEIYRNRQLPTSSAGAGGAERTPMNARTDSENNVNMQNAPNTVEHMVNEPNEAVNCDATVAASCLAFFPAVGTPGIVATRQRDAICATPPEPTEAFSRANLWKNEVGMVKRLEGFEALNGGVAHRGGLSAASSQQQERKKTTAGNKKSKLGDKHQQQQNKPAAKMKKTSSDNSMKSRSASGEETCYHRLPRWVLDQYMESHNVVTNQ